FATGFLATAFLATGFLAAAFLATGFLATAFLATGFLAAAFLATGFFATTFLAAGFFAAGFFAAVAILFLLHVMEKIKLLGFKTRQHHRDGSGGLFIGTSVLFACANEFGTS
ncbi:MAG: hypothetical protein Q7T06_04615, partial [Herminiimonas sp.]